MPWKTALGRHLRRCNLTEDPNRRAGLRLEQVHRFHTTFLSMAGGSLIKGLCQHFTTGCTQRRHSNGNKYTQLLRCLIENLQS